MRRTYYQVLGVGRYASPTTIKRAFKRLVLTCHPDINPDDELAAERTRQLVEAYNVLSDPVAKREYDLLLADDRDFALQLVRLGEPCYPAAVSRVLFVAVSLFLLIFSAVTFWNAIASDRADVIRPFLPEIKYPLAFREFPTLADPTMTDLDTWYHTQEYKLSLANGWAKNEMLKAYNNALARALKRRDYHRASFYRCSIKDANACFPGVF